MCLAETNCNVLLYFTLMKLLHIDHNN